MDDPRRPDPALPARLAPPPAPRPGPRPRPRSRAGAPPPECPRERLLAQGPDALSTADLLEVLLAPAGARGRGLGLLDGEGALRRLARSSVRELESRHGLGRGVALRLGAALALARRLTGERLPRGRLLRASAEIFEHFHERLRGLRKERCAALLPRVHWPGRARGPGRWRLPPFPP